MKQRYRWSEWLQPLHPQAGTESIIIYFLVQLKYIILHPDTLSQIFYSTKEVFLVSIWGEKKETKAQRD